VRTNDEEYHFQHASDNTTIYNELKNAILSIGNDITIKPMKLYIAFVRKTNFIDIALRKNN